MCVCERESVCECVCVCMCVCVCVCVCVYTEVVRYEQAAGAAVEGLLLRVPYIYIYVLKLLVLEALSN